MLAIIRAVETLGFRGTQQSGRPAERSASPSGLLVLDEPTVFLARESTDQLFRIVRDIVSGGSIGVLFVSHDLDEVKEITDRCSVLRDGRLTGTVDTASTSKQQLVEMIVGRSLGDFEAAAHVVEQSAAPLVSVDDAHGGVVDGFSLTLRSGEIVGLTGLMGSGFDEVPYLMFGAKAGTGSLTVGGQRVELNSMSPGRAMQHGMCLIPGDRKNDGCVAELSVGENIILPLLDRLRGRWGLQRKTMRAQSLKMVHQYDVRPADPDAVYSVLSGGNQQKALLAKWLQTDPAVVLLHEPTQGVDIGARAQIFDLLGRVAAQGAAILVASTDCEQLAAVCDRVVVMSRGRTTRELTGSDLTKERITAEVLNSTPPQDGVPS